MIHSWSWNWAHGGGDRSTGGAYSPRHLIPRIVFPGVRASLMFTVLWIVPFTWSGHRFWLQVLQVSSVYLIWHTEFDCGFFRLPDLTHWFWLQVSSVYLIWHTDFDCGFFRLPDLAHWFWLQVSSVYLIWHTDFDCRFLPFTWFDTLNLTAGSSVYLIWHTDFDCRFLPFTWFGTLILTAGFFRLPNWDTLILTNGFFAFEMGLTAGVTGPQGILTRPRHLIPPPAGQGVHVRSLSDL
jgi:hypothetical protein